MEYYQIWFSVIAFYYTLILFGFVRYSNKGDHLNNIIAFGTLFFVFIHIFFFLALMNQEMKLRFFMVPLWLLILGVPLLLISIIILITTISIRVYEKMGNKDLLT